MTFTCDFCLGSLVSKDLWRAVLASGPAPTAPGLETHFWPRLVTHRQGPHEKGAFVAISHTLGSALILPRPHSGLISVLRRLGLRAQLLCPFRTCPKRLSQAFP